MKKTMPRLFCFLLIVFLALSFGTVFALDVHAQSETQLFFVESSYDLFGRKELEAQLVRSDGRVYFYVETSWWGGRSAQEQNDLRIALAELGLEFQNHIYPVLTSTFGSEPKPGIDKDERITILVHQMGNEAGGYFRSGDVYERLQSPGSNGREMLYLNSQYIGKKEAKSFLAHEFVHLITVNQKDLLRRVTEETWLNEARAEYAPTLLGYDDTYQGSNLERRVRDFLSRPSDSLTEWLEGKEDYGVVSVFMHYLVEHYGVRILADSLQSSQVGISSITEALKKNGFQEDFAQVYRDWAIAVLVNDCALGTKYCFTSTYMRNLRITPVFYYLPGGETIFSTYHTVPYWSSSWHRLTGGGQNLTLAFEGAPAANFEVPYVLCDSGDKCSVGFLTLDEKQKGEIALSGFDTKYHSLTIAPFVQGNASGLDERENSFPFSWQATVRRNPGVAVGAESISQLLARISDLQEQVRRLQIQLAQVRGQSGIASVSCAHLETDLSFGMRGEQVRCLQEFLRVQGPEIYPEALVTGNFLSLTRQAVIRFQEKYALEILAPFALNKGTGYVGQGTRAKINQLL